VEEFSDDYSVINDDTGEIAKPGETVVSASGVICLFLLRNK
jgi:hypothetical protein